MVLLDGIELSTSPLPRECSTTELQQQRRSSYKQHRCRARGFGWVCHARKKPARARRDPWITLVAIYA